MKMKLVFAVMMVVAMSACQPTVGKLYPVKGPLAAQTPMPVYIVKVTGGRSGTYTITVSGGEVCKGTWTRVPSITGAPAGGDSTNDSTASIWDMVYGPGYYVAHVLGSKIYDRGVAAGSRGTVLDVEMFVAEAGGEHTPSVMKGVAKDNQGNIYKLAF